MSASVRGLSSAATCVWQQALRPSAMAAVARRANGRRNESGFMNRLEAVVKLRKLAARHTIAGVGKLPPIERWQREGPGSHRQAEPRRRIHDDFSFARSARLLFLRIPCVLRPSFAMNLIRLLLCAF